MGRATTPVPNSTSSPSNSAPPSTPGNIAMRVQRNAPAPSTPSGHHRRMSYVSRTPSTSALVCSSSASTFARVTVHTAKCSECDFRNKGTMLRCPGCTFQICKPCQDRREKAGRSLAHGTMLSPYVATPGTSGSVARRRPVATGNVEKEKGENEVDNDAKNVGEERGAVERGDELVEAKGKTCVIEPGPEPKLKLKFKAKNATPSDDWPDISLDGSSADDYGPDPASPTSNKRRLIELTSQTGGISDMPAPLLQPITQTRDSTRPNPGGSTSTEKPLSDMTTDELFAHYGVNTPANPYKAHLLSRGEPVVSNPVIEIPEAVQRGFKPRPTAGEIQKNIQERVREKMGLAQLLTGADGQG